MFWFISLTIFAITQKDLLWWDLWMVYWSLSYSATLKKTLASCVRKFGVCCLEILVRQGRIVLTGHTTMFPLYWKLRMPPGHFQHLRTLGTNGNNRHFIIGWCGWSWMERKNKIVTSQRRRKIMGGTHVVSRGTFYLTTYSSRIRWKK